jgi:hypothetical protein
MPDPLAVLLLPDRLEEFALSEHARDLLRAPHVIALEPPRVSWARLARLPDAFAARTALRQAKRLKLPGTARVVIIYSPLQTMLGLSSGTCGPRKRPPKLTPSSRSDSRSSTSSRASAPRWR